MKISDLKLDGIYLYDRNNQMGQYEDGVKVVKVNAIKRGIFQSYAICAPYIRRTKSFINKIEMKVANLDLLEPLSKNPEENVVVRYPYDLPSFSENDVQLLAKVSTEMATKFFTQSELNDIELIALVGLLKKIKFYSSLPCNSIIEKEK